MSRARRIVLIHALCLSWSAAAGEIYQFYRGIRPLGMGGAGVATVNDETALLVNPAMLTKLRDEFVTVVDPEADVNFDAFRINGGSPTKMGDPAHALGQLEPLQNQHYHQRAQAFPSLVWPGFGAGVFAKQVIDAELTDSPALYSYDYTQDLAAVAGFGSRFFGGILKFGGAGRLVSRREVRRDDLNPNSTALGLSALAVEGTGLAADASLSLSLPVTWLPTLAVVYRDIGRTAFTYGRGLTHPTAARPLAVDQSVDVGFSISPIHAFDHRSTWSIEYDGVGGPGEPLRHLHAGVEVNLADALFLRAGVNQRYWTAGVECAFSTYQVQLATYGEDIGVNGHPREDRRGVAKFSFLF